MQINHLSNALLTLLLLPRLAKTAEEKKGNVRVVIVASETHVWTKLSLADFPDGKILPSLNDKEITEKLEKVRFRYPDSKRASSIFTHHNPTRTQANITLR